MEVEDARLLLLDAEESEAPVVFPASVLAKLKLDDVPEGVSIQVGTEKDRMIELEWDGRLYRNGQTIIAEAEYLSTRKYWYSPLGLEQYMDLVRRAVETRHRMRGDVKLTHYEDDGAYINLHFVIPMTSPNNLRDVFEHALAVTDEIEEAAQQAEDEVGKHVAEIAARLSGWGSESLDDLVTKVETAKNTDDRGRALEELCSRLFETVPGFTVSGRIKTATEEIDLSIINDSVEPRLRRESAMILAECKNWSGKCGKNEFVIFREKWRIAIAGVPLVFSFLGTASQKQSQGKCCGEAGKIRL